MAKTPDISDAEWEVMAVLWDRSPLAAAEVVDALHGKKKWSPRTIKTLLARLVKKGALAVSAQQNRYLYRPKVTRRDSVSREGRSFLHRVFAGSAGEMLAHFVEETDLSRDEIEQLKQLLSRKGR